jgi:hypothetical protein
LPFAKALSDKTELKMWEKIRKYRRRKVSEKVQKAEI